MTRGVYDSMSPGRPVRRPTDAQARQALARDLARGTFDVDGAKAVRMLDLPLMDVALEASDGLATAEAKAGRVA